MLHPILFIHSACKLCQGTFGLYRQQFIAYFYFQTQSIIGLRAVESTKSLFKKDLGVKLIFAKKWLVGGKKATVICETQTPSLFF